ncbi:MAG: glycosyltransferase family 4 protein [Brevefilum sp.]|nr:glycosyltransferase family 4 protein [Brevefilum sp.]MDT8381280.1 glycosyltransferase family 4 protein [Brevefilum sp.]MDW7753895.1 glycosyltransferase family 4 protein [Brevefilum sp.]
MRVLYFTEGDSPHDQRFLRALSGTAHNVYALRQKECTPTTPDGIVELDWPGGQPNWRYWGGWEKALIQFQKILDEIQPDVVHAGPIQGPALLTALSGFQNLVTMSWGSDILARAQRSPWTRCATKYALDHTKVFLGDCQTVIDAAKTYGFPEERSLRFPWGVDLQHFSPQNGKAEGEALRRSLGWDDKFIILCNRSWYPIYGVDVLAKAFVASAEENNELRLLLVGDGPQSDYIHSILVPVEDKAHFPGWEDQTDLPGVYCGADLFVSPSHCDGSSISLLEALACGRPVLVSDIPSNKEWIKPGETGELFTDGDPAALIEKILLMAGHFDLAHYGENARFLAEAQADWDQNFEKLLQAYHMAL